MMRAAAMVCVSMALACGPTPAPQEPDDPQPIENAKPPVAETETETEPVKNEQPFEIDQPVADPNGTLGAGTISGIVRDHDDTVMPGVTIVATSDALQGQQAAITDGDGRWILTNLPPGTYTIHFYYETTQVVANMVTVADQMNTVIRGRLDSRASGGEVVTISNEDDWDYIAVVCEHLLHKHVERDCGWRWVTDQRSCELSVDEGFPGSDEPDTPEFENFVRWADCISDALDCADLDACNEKYYGE